MSYPCELIDRPALPVLSIRAYAAVQNLPAIVGQAYGTITQYLGQLGQQPAGAPFVGYFNMDMQNLDLEIGFPVATKLPGQGDIQPGKMLGGKAAACLYTGPYDNIAPAYEAIMQWMQSQRYEALGPCYEIYLNDPAQTPPEALQTQIVFPVK